MAGCDAFVGVYTGKAKGVGDVRVRAAHVTDRAAGLHARGRRARRHDFPRVEAEFTRALASFRELSSSEAAADAPQPPRRLRRAARRLVAVDRAACRQRGSCRRRVWRSMNGFAVNVQPPAGTALKIVVEG